MDVIYSNYHFVMTCSNYCPLHPPLLPRAAACNGHPAPSAQSGSDASGSQCGRVREHCTLCVQSRRLVFGPVLNNSIVTSAIAYDYRKHNLPIRICISMIYL